MGRSNLRYIKAKEGHKVNFYMIDVIMISEVIKIGADQTVEIGEVNLVDKVKVD